MEKTQVLIVSSSRNLIRHVTRSLASVGYDIQYCGFDRQIIGSRLPLPEGMCVIDADDENHSEIRWLLEKLRLDHPQVIPLLLSHGNHNQIILELLRSEHLNNLVATHGAMSSNIDLIDESELIVTCQKLFSRDIFGIEKYLPTWGIKVSSHVIASTEEKQTALSELEVFLTRIDCYGAIKSSILLVADELLMNALFNAPLDGQGRPKYKNTDRRANLLLEPHETVGLTYACDGRSFLISVTDQFGSLDRRIIIKYLERCFANSPAEVEEKRHGAGLGLYLVFNSITQLTFNIQAGVSTEVIAGFYVRSGARAFKLSGRSLNLFFQRG